MASLSSIKKSLYKFLIFWVVMNISVWPVSSFTPDNAQFSESVSNVYKNENGGFARIIPIDYNELKQKEKKINLLLTPDNWGCCWLDGFGCYAAQNESDCDDIGGVYNDGYNVGFGQNPCYNDTGDPIQLQPFIEECTKVYCCQPLSSGIANTACADPRPGVATWDCNDVICATDCGSNTQTCYCGDSQINQDEYCCWDVYRTQSYTVQSQCIAECQPPPFDCALGTPITQSCICDGYEQTSGFCCEDGAYDLDPNGDNCLPIADCTVGLVSQPCKCDGQAVLPPGWCCIDGTFVAGATNDSLCPAPNRCIQYEYACIDSDLYGCEGPQPLYDSDCRDELNTPNAICCGIPDTTLRVDCCNNADECRDLLYYNYPSCSNPNYPCAETCQQNPCFDGKITDENTPYTNLGDYYCYCPHDYTPASRRNITTDEGYCCDSGTRYSLTPCVTAPGATITGYVYNTTTSNRIQGARVVIRNNTWSKEATGFTDVSGTYFITSAPAGTYEFIVIAAGFGPIPQPAAITITQAQFDTNAEITGQNLMITPAVLGPCDGFDPPNVTSFTAQVAVPGQKDVILSWANPACSNIENLLLEFYHDTTRYYYELAPSTTSFNDNNVGDMNWGQTYYYDISVRYTTGITAGPITANITLGENECDGRPVGDQFCYQNTIWECDENNNKNEIQICAPQQCVEDANGASCVDVNLQCAGDYGNPLGMFGYSEITACLTDWCYYDYSNTTVDMCDSCSGISACYGYRSEFACEGNGAGVPANKQGNDLCLLQADCEWYPTVYQELGKGICFDPDYNGHDYCGMCNITDGLFMNIGCNQDVCSRLGACYSKYDSCQTCTEQTVCEDFTTEESCVNAVVGANLQNFDIAANNCPSTLTPSNDACGLGKCKWSGNTCFKDGDNDNIADCTTTNQDCKLDQQEPHTWMGPVPPVIKATGADIDFTVDELYPDKFYYCIYKLDRDSPCCGADFIELSYPSDQPFVTINLVNDTATQNIVNESGIYSIRYYSTDSNKNIEQMHENNLTFDLEGPGQQNVLTVRLFEAYSLLDVFVYSGEFMECDKRIDPPTTELPGGTFNTGIKKSFNATFQYNIDALVRFTSMCTDLSGNEENVTTEVLIDRVDGIIIGTESPNDQTLNTDTIDIYLETSKPGICIIFELNGTGHLDNKILTQNQMSPVRYNHTLNSQTVQNYTYLLRVDCSFTDATADTTYLRFAIDQLAPATSAENSDGTPFNFSKYYFETATVYLDCVDYSLGGNDYPDEFGPATLWYCVGGACGIGSPYWQAQDVSDGNPFDLQFATTSQLSYYCIDAGGNTENIRSNTVLIDTTAPHVWITSPSDGTIIKANAISVSGAFDDPSPSQVESVAITRNGINFPSTILGMQFSNDNVILADGINVLSATIRTTSGFIGPSDNSVTVIKDAIGPVISGISICDDLGSCIPDNVQFGHSLTFEATITDGGVGVDNTSAKVIVNGTEIPLTTTDEVFYSGTANLPLAIGNYSASFIAEDAFGTPSLVTEYFYVNDTALPEVEGIAIYDRDDDLFENPIDTSVNPLIKGEYTALIDVSEPIITGTSIIYYYLTGYTSNPLDIVVYDAATSTYKANFEIPTGVEALDNIYDTAYWNITLIDTHGLIGNYDSYYGFDINTIGPSIIVLRQLDPYYNNEPIHVIGQASIAGATVEVSAWDGDTGTMNKTSTNVSSAESSVIISESLAFPYGAYTTSDNTVYILGDHTSSIREGIDYIEFSDMNEVPKPRFKVQNVTALSIIDVTHTKITLVKNLTENISGGMVSVYAEEFPTGYFDISVGLFPGLNDIVVKAKIEPDMWGSSYQPNPQVIFDNDSVVFTNSSPQGVQIFDQVIVNATVSDSFGIQESGVDPASRRMDILGPCNFTNLDASNLSYHNGTIIFYVWDFDCNGTNHFANGQYTVNVSATDRANNPVTSLQWNFTVDTKAPEYLNVIFTPGIAKGDTLVEVLLEADEQLVAEPNMTIVYEAIEGTIYQNISWYNNDNNQTWYGRVRILDNVTVETSITPLSIILSGEDIVGHIGTNIIYTNNLTIDTVAPDINLLFFDLEFNLGAARAGEQINLTFEVSEDLKQNATVTLVDPIGRTANATYLTKYLYTYDVYTYTVETTPSSPEGRIHINATAEDLAGNIQDKLITDSGLIIDRTKPRFDSPSLFLPSKGSVINDIYPYILVSFKDDESGIWRDKSELWKDGISFFNLVRGKNNFTYQPSDPFINVTETNVTNVTLTAKIYDLANNGNETNWTFTINRNVPNTPSFVIEDGIKIGNRWFTNETNPRLELNFSENVTALTYNINPSSSANLTNVDNKTYYIDVDSAPSDEYLLEVQAVKPDFTQRGKYYFGFVVDTVIPNLTIQADPEVIGLDNATVLTIEFYDEYFDRIELAGSGYSETFDEFSVSPIIYQLNFSSDGIYPITITAYDKAGNVNQTSLSIIRDTNEPMITIQEITNASQGMVSQKSDILYRTSTNYININGFVTMDQSQGITVEDTLVTLLIDDLPVDSYLITTPAATGIFSFTNVALNLNQNNTIKIVARSNQNGMSGSKQFVVQHTDQGPTAALVNEVVNTTTPLLSFTTDMPSSACDITTTTGLARAPLNNVTSNSFNIQILSANEFIENQYNIMDVRCFDEDLGIPRNTQLGVFVDTIKPTISNVIYDYDVDLINNTLNYKEYLQYVLKLANLEVFATDNFDDEVRCKRNTEWIDDNYTDNHIQNIELPEGNHVLTIACVDKAGWESDPFVINITIDLAVGVEIRETIPASGSYVNRAFDEIYIKTNIASTCTATYGSTTVDLDGTDTEHYYSGINGLISEFGVADDEDYTISIICSSDVGGIASDFKDVTFTTDFSLDAPTITFPNQGFVTNNSLITVRGNTERDSQFRIAVNGQEQGMWRDIDAQGDFEGVATLSNGTNTIEVLILDRAANEDSNSVSGYYTNIGPEITILAPTNEGPFRDVDELVAIIEPTTEIEVNLSRSYIELKDEQGNNVPLETQQIIGNDTIAYNIGVFLEDGYYIITAVPYDVVGNEGERKTATFEISNQVPEIIITTPDSGDIITSSFVRFEGDIYANENIGSATLVISNLEYEYDLIGDITGTHFDTGAENNDLEFGDNTYSFYIAVNTTIGNYGESAERYFTVDTTGPGGCIIIGDEEECPE